MNSPELTVAVKSAQRLCAKTMGMPHRTASSQASDSMSSTPFGGSPVQGSSPIMWGSSTPLGSSPTHSGSSYAYMPPLDLATVPQLSALALQYHTGGSSPNGLSPSASPPGGSSPRSVQSFMELSFGGLSLGQ